VNCLVSEKDWSRIPLPCLVRSTTPVKEPHPAGTVWYGVRIQSGFALLALLVSLTDAEALSCFPSAAAVRQESPQAWPSWTLREPGHEGTKCWYASMRSTAPDHQIQKVQREVKRGITDTLMQSMTNGSGSSLHSATVPTDAVSPVSATSQASFDDRFSAVFEGNLSVEWTSVQRVIDLFLSDR